VFAKLSDWLDHRTGFRKVRDALLLEHIPGGAKWRYVWGSCLAFVFAVQLITGVLLMTSYSPGDSTAWSSVYFIQYEMDFGWCIRGLHHFGSQTMVVLLGLHMLQVVIAGAHLPPREINWWLGLLLLAAVLGLSLTGYLLPWDQKGYWATQVATNIAGSLPLVGPAVQKIIVGGPVYGHHTLTRFFTLHVAILPALVIALIMAHVAVFRRHGVTAPKNAAGEGLFWPDQAFRDLLVSLIIFGVMLGLVIYGHGHKITSAAATERGFYERVAHAGKDGRGANLDAPADPSRPYPARPEWYFLFLFQLLKYFEGDQEIVGTVIVPSGVFGLLFLLPLLGYGRMRPFGHIVGVTVVVALLLGVGFLTYLALDADREPTLSSEEIEKLDDKQKQLVEKARLFQTELRDAADLARRAIQLADEGIPTDGAVYLLRRDPLTQGPRLFRQHCGTCHTHGTDSSNENPTASDLEDFGTQKWILGLLNEPDSPRYFAKTNLKAMSNWIKLRRESARKKGATEEKKLADDFEKIAVWLGEHPRDEAPTNDDKKLAWEAGSKAFANRCNECHSFNGTGGTSTTRGPDFTGYGDADWIRMMIMSPACNLRYGAKNKMPAFRDLEGISGNLEAHELNQTKIILLRDISDDDPTAETKRKTVDEATRATALTEVDRELIIRWLLKDYRVIFGGEPISGPPKG
jgi:ubiquinol-cytochrome c reductase cytochrome b subunit